MDKKTLLQAVNNDYPSSIPVIFHINLSCWDYYDRDLLCQLILAHPLLFPEGLPLYSKPNKQVPYPDFATQGVKWRDPWDCVWETTMSGLIGSVTGHSLKNLEDIYTFIPPNPEHTTHWYPVNWQKGKSPTGGSIGFFSCLQSGEIGHGHTFLKMIDLLGYEQAIFTLYDEPKELKALEEMLLEFNLGLVERFIEIADVEWLGYAEDLGMQKGPMLSPTMFKKHILPIYERIMAPAKDNEVIIHMHSDGDIRDVSDSLLTLPIRVLNIQDNVNSIEWIEQNLKHKVALDIDIDRQFITQQEDPDKVVQYLHYLLQKLYDPSGGLILTYGLYPGTPISVVSCMMDYLEKIASGEKPWIG